MNRRRFLQTCASIFVTSPLLARDRLFTPASPPVPGIIDIGSTKQPFLDDLLVFQATKIRPVLTRPTPSVHNPVLVADRPWESDGRVSLHGPAVIYDADEAKFKMWYNASAVPGRGRAWCYAVSEDGQNWEKPELGLFEFNGSKANNIVAFWNDPSFSGVFKDSHDPDPARRYKAWGEFDGPVPNHTGGAVVAFSPDGIHWHVRPGNPLIKHGPNMGDGTYLLGWDHKIDKYVLWARPGHGLAPEIYGTGDHRHIRSLGYATSDDFIHWTPTRVMLTPDHDDRYDHQYLHMTGAIDGEFYIGLNTVLESFQHSVSVYLMSSRDGFHWTWVDRKVPFLGHEAIGTHEDGRMLHTVPSAPLFRDDEVFVYYTALNRAHARPEPSRRADDANVALCTLPRDRWVGLVAGPYRATLVTQPLLFTGSKLHVDLQAGTPQQSPRIPPRFDECDVRVALEGPSGGTIAGFTIDRCQPLVKSGVHEVTWQGKSLAPLAGKPVRIRFEMRNAALYSIQFV